MNQYLGRGKKANRIWHYLRGAKHSSCAVRRLGKADVCMCVCLFVCVCLLVCAFVGTRVELHARCGHASAELSEQEVQQEQVG